MVAAQVYKQAAAGSATQSPGIGVLILMRTKLFAVSLLLALVPCESAVAIGARTHAEIARMAVDTYLKHDVMLPGLAALFDSDDNMRALYSGCAFPDWGYGLGSGDAAEYSHWHPFMERYASLLQRRFPPPWDAEAQRQISFFFGVVSHNISDIPWHFCEEAHKSFLQAGFDVDGAGHSEIEFACDYFLYVERALEPSIALDAWFPIDLLLDVFDGSGYNVTRADLKRGTARSRAMFFGGWMAGGVQYQRQKARMPWVHAHYGDYYYGGKEHGAAITASMTRYYYARLQGWRYYQNTPEYAAHARSGGKYVPRLHISETHLSKARPDHNAGGEPFLIIGGEKEARSNGLVRVVLGDVSPDFEPGAAQLWLYCAGVDGAASGVLTAYRILRPWRAGSGVSDDVSGTEGHPAVKDEANWRQSGVEQWTAPGCEGPDTDYVATPVAAVPLPDVSDAGDWISLDVTDAVTHWLARPDENHGLLLRLECDDDNAPIARFLSSHAFKGREDGLCGGRRVAFRPVLILR